jgi:hypothetical protein
VRDHQIKITDQHLALLQRMYIDWDDSAYDGAPAVGLKRPYGNSDVMGDVAEILGLWTYDEETDEEMPEEIEDQCRTIHEQMAVVLQVLVRNPLTFSTGTWVNQSTYGVDYVKES